MKCRMDQRGISLIQIIVALAVTAVTATVIMQSMTQSYKTQQTNLYKQEMAELSNKLALILADSEACKNTFGGENPNSSSSFTVIKDKADAVAWDLAVNAYGSLQLKLAQIRLEDFVGPDDGAGLVDGSLGSTNLALYFEPKANTQYANQSPLTKVKLNVHTDSVTGLIIDCFTSVNSLGLLWMREEDTPANIMHTTGFLGIGTDSPEVEVDVVGGIQIQNLGAEKVKLQVESSSYQVELNTDKPFIFQNISQGRRADIDMGTLKTTRHLYLGNTGLACNASSTGALRYNGSVIQYCNGSWKSLIYE